jgi:hypothetical protein
VSVDIVIDTGSRAEAAPNTPSIPMSKTRSVSGHSSKVPHDIIAAAARIDRRCYLYFGARCESSEALIAQKISRSP